MGTIKLFRIIFKSFIEDTCQPKFTFSKEKTTKTDVSSTLRLVPSKSQMQIQI